MGARKKTGLRYTPDQCDRLERARLFLGETAQAFQLHAVMRQVEEVEADMAARKERRKLRADATSASLAAPGLGLFQHRQPELAPVEPSPPAPVAVYVGARGSAEDELISRLAKRALDAASYERDTRIREGYAALKTYAKDEAERRGLAERFEAEIAKASEHSSLFGHGLEKWFKGLLPGRSQGD